MAALLKSSSSAPMGLYNAFSGSMNMLSTDGTRLFYRWHPVSEARASVVVIHGFAEHSGRYSHVLDRLNAAGFNALAFDYRGHGHAEGSRVYIDRFSEYVEDTRCALDFVEDRAGRLPLFILGHSQGGLAFRHGPKHGRRRDAPHAGRESARVLFDQVH